ncbi:uncharacterized protein LOC122499548 [Leptopilina heterotoma]|uniref:uncharacterized protein LOC122499548 n=1 Tax=Leptopilina heterotoma TaxID=63436 RepID=UPI001CA9A5AC|nr:uncharacterized protein LOC122499548 [Leptopilina heterotoma]
MMASKCKECGCACSRCIKNERRLSDMHLHAEIENLRQRLMERDSHIVTMETQFLNEADKFPNGEMASLKDEMLIWQDKYARLYEAHKRVQKVNQNLEDKLLRIVDKCETEKGAFTKDIATLSHRLADANYTIHRLTQDNEKYRNDVNLAIQLLQCKPSNFIGQKYESLPSEVQAKVRTYIAQKGPISEPKQSDVKSITVPISTFPPTAMVYNVTRASISKSDSSSSDDDPKPPVDIVSAAIMAKVLEDREKERIFARHCDTCTCHRSVLKVNTEVQTVNVFNTCNECQTRQDSSRSSDDKTEKPDYYKNDRTSKLHYNQIRDSYSHSIFPVVNDCSKTFSKIRTQQNSDNSKNAIYHYVNEVAESKNNQKFDNTKSTNRLFGGTKSYSNSKNTMKQQNSLNITAETKLLSTENSDDKLEEKADQMKLSKKHNQWSDIEKASLGGHAAQVEIINDRLWKSSWTKSDFHDFNHSNDDRRTRTGKDTHIDVINDRVWKHNKSKTKEAKPTQLTLIKVASVDELTNEIRPESTVSPSFSSDSIIFSTSDPSSISSDMQSTNKCLSKQEKKNCNIDLQAGKSERTTGPRSSVMRVTGKSNNILLDNVGNYQQPILTENSVTFPNTALVHTTSSCRSGRTVSTSSEENSSILSPDNVHLQRVADWVKSSVQLDKQSNQSDKLSIDTKHFNQFSRNESLAIKEQVVVVDNVAKNSEKKEKDLIIFDPSSDEEKDLSDLKRNSKENSPLADHYQVANISIGNSTADNHYEVKVTKEMEETYLKLTASLDPVALRLASMTGADLTIEKYRKDHKRLQNQKIPSKSDSTT